MPKGTTGVSTLAAAQANAADHGPHVNRPAGVATLAENQSNAQLNTHTVDE
jgi:hypothetical protein